MLLLELLQKTYIEIQCNLYYLNTYYHDMLLTQSTANVCHMRDRLWVLYFPAKQCVSSMSAHILSVSVSHFRLLKREIVRFISSSLWLQHPELNPVKYKIYIQISSGPASKIFATRAKRHYGVASMALSNASSITQQTDDVNVFDCVCVCERTTSYYSVWRHILHLYILMC